MTTPAGYPFWQRGRAPSLYGGTPEKRDYGGIGAVNAKTDVTAAQYLRLCSDVAAIANVSPICTILCTWRWNAHPLVTFVSCPWAAPVTVSYTGNVPPSSLYPFLIQGSATQMGVALPESALDEFGVSGDIVANMVLVTWGAAPVTGVYWEGPTGTNEFTIGGLPSGSNVDLHMVVW